MLYKWQQLHAFVIKLNKFLLSLTQMMQVSTISRVSLAALTVEAVNAVRMVNLEMNFNGEVNLAMAVEAECPELPVPTDEPTGEASESVESQETGGAEEEEA